MIESKFGENKNVKCIVACKNAGQFAVLAGVKLKQFAKWTSLKTLDRFNMRKNSF